MYLTRLAVAAAIAAGGLDAGLSGVARVSTHHRSVPAAPPRVTVTLRVIEQPTEAATETPTAEGTPAEATPRPAETPEPPTPEAQANPTAVP